MQFPNMQQRTQQATGMPRPPQIPNIVLNNNMQQQQQYFPNRMQPRPFGLVNGQQQNQQMLQQRQILMRQQHQQPQQQQQQQQQRIQQLAMPPTTQQFFKAGPGQTNGWPGRNQMMPRTMPTSNNLTNNNAAPTSGGGFALPIYMKKKP